ncbi:MAG: excalibur calcium-binding domain-containing protein [Pseudomonadota bacterium]
MHKLTAFSSVISLSLLTALPDRKRGEYHCHRSANPQPPSNHGGGAYRNCAAARAAGAAPFRRRDLGYGAHLDRDNDGIGCE